MTSSPLATLRRSQAERRCRLEQASMELRISAFAVAFTYGRLDYRSQEAIDPQLRAQLDDLALKLAQYQSVRDAT